jgi:hypothetical protein
MAPRGIARAVAKETPTKTRANEDRVLCAIPHLLSSLNAECYWLRVANDYNSVGLSQAIEPAGSLYQSSTIWKQ